MEGEKKYKGVRRRRWGKWVSEIRVPSSRERLWLGSYSTPEAAAVAHDTAVFLLRGPSSSGSLNFPESVASMVRASGVTSPRSVQRVASDCGMAIDAQLLAQRPEGPSLPPPPLPPPQSTMWANGGELRHGTSQEELDISVYDMEIYI